MILLVIDASIAVKWFRDEPGTEQALALVQERYLMIAPATILLECHNTLAKLFLGGHIVFDQLANLMPELQRFLAIEPVDGKLADQASLISLSPFPGSGVPLANVRPFNVYDCIYVALAMRDQATLVTADAMQAQVAKAHGCRVRQL